MHLKQIQDLIKNSVTAWVDDCSKHGGVVDVTDKKTNLLLRPRPANGTGKSPFEHWHNHN